MRSPLRVVTWRISATIAMALTLALSGCSSKEPRPMGASNFDEGVSCLSG